MYLGGNLRWFPLIHLGQPVPCEVIQPSPGFSIPHCGRCRFRIPDNGSPDSLSVEFGFRIPIVCRIPDNSSWMTDSKALELQFHEQKSAQILHSTSKGFSDYGWESGVPDMEQYTDSHWIVGTQVSAADFAGRKTKQKTDILTRIRCSKVANLSNRWTGSWVKDRLLHRKTFNRFDIYWFWFLLTNKFLSCSPELLHSYSINKGFKIGLNKYNAPNV